MKLVIKKMRVVILCGMMSFLSEGAEAQAIENDNFAHGIVLAADGPVQVTSTTTSATIEDGEDEVLMIFDGEWYPWSFSTVWYRWTPQVSGWCRCHTGGSASDTVLRISKGTSLDSQTRIGWNDEAFFETEAGDGERGSGMVFWADANTTYHIAVGAFDPMM
jgi:hypothetical protein